MNEPLFKLKKDGKTVGYCKLLKYRDPLDSVRHWRGWGYSKNGKNWEQQIITFDTAHPFVTKDKNGKDVFAGDKVKAGSWEFEVIWQKYGYGLKGIKHGWWRQFNEFEDIELIEEKEDE